MPHLRKALGTHLFNRAYLWHFIHKLYGRAIVRRFFGFFCERHRKFFFLTLHYITSVSE